MNILVTPYVSILADVPLQMVKLRWTGYCPSEDYRLALETALKAVEENGFLYWLADLRSMEAIMHDDERWTVEKWFPKLGQAGLERMAIVTSTDAFNAMSVDRIMDDSQPSYGFEVAYFDNKQLAEEWLREKLPLIKPVS